MLFFVALYWYTGNKNGRVTNGNNMFQMVRSVGVIPRKLQ